METAASIEKRLDEAERLLLAPTAVNLERVAQQLTPVVSTMEAVTESMAAAKGGGRTGDVTRDFVVFAEGIGWRVRRLSTLLEGASQIRLGLSRAAAAGLTGYSAAGSSENRQKPGAPTRLTATA